MSHDLAILDVGSPELDELAVLRDARQRRCDLPILVLTARETPADRVVGLDAGADDYLIKPFDLDELSARIRALLRRRAGRLAASVASLLAASTHLRQSLGARADASKLTDKSW